MKAPSKAIEMMNDPHVMDVVRKANALIREGGTVYFKWTCQACGQRATCVEPNALHTSYLHEDCGAETKTINGDLGFLLVIKPKETPDALHN